MLLPNIDTFGPPLRGHLGAGKSDQRYMIQQPQALANPGSLGMIKDRNESMKIQTHSMPARDSAAKVLLTCLLAVFDQIEHLH